MHRERCLTFVCPEEGVTKVGGDTAARKEENVNFEATEFGAAVEAAVEGDNGEPLKRSTPATS